MHKEKEYSKIKLAIDDYFILRSDKKYEDFIKVLINILKI